MADEYITVAEARERLGNISKAKMAKLIADGKIPTHDNALDGRSKLIRIEDLEAFLSSGVRAPGPRKRKAQTA
jgi:excisionase family DNA binding protein